jgi:hypothetical protein
MAGATGVGLNRTVSVTFSEVMDVTTLTASTLTLGLGVPPTLVAGMVVVNGNTALFLPAAPLSGHQTYTATATTGVKDACGNALEQDYTWSFTTGADVSAPTVSHTVPARGATGAWLGGHVAVTFSEAVDPLTVNAGTITLGLGSVPVAGSVACSGVTAVFSPVAALAANSLYSGSVTTGVQDLAGNSLVRKYDWTFTTGSAPDMTPPTVSSTVPRNGALAAPLGGNLAATFSEVMDPASITAWTFTLRNGLVAVDCNVTYVGLTAVFNPLVALEANTVYSASITTGATDLAGHPLEVNHGWTFTTGSSRDTTAPSVTWTYPANDASGVSLGRLLSATFSEPMDPLTVTPLTFTLRHALSAVSGTVAYAGVTATFNPDEMLLPHTDYVAAITGGAADMAGNRMASEHTWAFRTGNAADERAPVVSSTVPRHGAVGIAPNRALAIVFSEYMDPLTISTATVLLGDGSSPIPGTVSYGGVTATFTPLSPLVAQTTYSGTVTMGARDLAGNSLEATYGWTFTTGIAMDAAPPEVSATVPEHRDVGVALGASLAVVFTEPMDPMSINSGTVRLEHGGMQLAGAVIYTGVTAVFAPASPLLPQTTYSATVSTGAMDLAGIALGADYAWTFTTGLAPDVTAPAVSWTVPTGGATGVLLGGSVMVGFSEPMNPLTLTPESFFLRDGIQGVAGAVSFGGVTATFTPSAALMANTVYTATVTPGAEDLAGHALGAAHSWSFTTGEVLDKTAPTVSGTSPHHGATGIAVDTSVAVTFSEAMDPLTVTSATLILRRGTAVVAGTVNFTGVTAILNPTSALLPNTSYTGTVTTGVSDLAGNTMEIDYGWSFTTGDLPDTTAPSVSSTVPAPAATGVAPGSFLTVTFNEAMDPLTITTASIELRNGLDAVAGSVGYTGVTATFQPGTVLVANTLYSASVKAAVRDLAGNAMAADYLWTFRTGEAADTTAPVVSSTVPALGALGVAVGSNISATFSEAMDPASMTAMTVTLAQGVVPVEGAVTYAGVTVTFNPAAALGANTQYTATIGVGVRDLSGNALSAAYVWTFTTGSLADVNPPEVSSTVPLDGATGVGLGNDLAATFTEAMDPLSVTTATFTLRQGATPISGTVTYAGVTATFNPSAVLSGNTPYTASLATGAKDLAGNPLAADYSWTFTTGATPDTSSPTVSSTVPVNGSTGFALGSNLTVTFSEGMDPASVNATTWTVWQGATPVPGAVILAGVTATFDPAASLAASTAYTAVVSTGVKDLAGNALAADYEWTFTTGLAPDVTAPAVDSTVPASDAVGVSPDSNLAVIFTEAVDPLTVTTLSVTLSRGLTAVGGTVTLSGVTATFNPTSDLEPNTEYTASVSTAVKDLAGNAMANAYQWSFTTGAFPDETPPFVVSTNPAAGALDVAVDRTINVTFSEVMEPLTFTAASFLLAGPGTVEVLGAVSYVGLKATFLPAADLLPNTLYTATVMSGVEDLAGNAMTNDVTWTFMTGAGAPLGPAPVLLGLAGDYVILSKSGVSTVPTSAVTGDIGVSPIDATAITGFSVTLDASQEFSRSDQVTGKLWAASYSEPTPTKLTTAVSNMETAYTDAAGRSLPDFTELGSGEIGGLTLVPGLYKWGTGVNISTDVTLDGGPNDVWIFLIAGDVTLASGKRINLSGGALPKNIFWQTFGQVMIGTTAHFEGVVLCMTAIVLETGASVNGRLLAQTAVVLAQNAVTQPAP